MIEKIVIAIITLIAGSFLTYMFTRFKVNAIIGHLNDSNVSKFSDFIDKNKDKVFFIDINIDSDEADEFRESKSITFFSKPDADSVLSPNALCGGIVFNFSQCTTHLDKDMRDTSQRIKGYVKETNSVGTNQGFFTYVFKDLPSEDYHNYKKRIKKL